jgi:hypothetical protein
LEKLKELSQSEDECSGDSKYVSQRVLVARQDIKEIKQTEVTVQEAVVESETIKKSQIIDATSQLAVQAAGTAELDHDSRSASPVPNGQPPTDLPSREMSSAPVQSAEVFSDTEDQYRRGMSGRRKKSLLNLFRIKKKKKKTDENKKNQKSIQSGFLSDSDTENAVLPDAKNRIRQRWRIFKTKSPTVLEEHPEQVIETSTEANRDIVSSNTEVTTQNLSVVGGQSKLQVPTAEGEEKILAKPLKPQGSAEVRRRKIMEESAREQMKEASKLVVALRKANQEKRKQCPEEDDNAQQKEDEEDRERLRKMSIGQDRPPLPPITEQKKQRAFESAIFTTWKGQVEPYPSSRLVQESLKDEMKVQQRNSTEIVLREEGEETTDQERDDATEWAKAGLSPADDESDEEENTDWHPELTSTLPRKRRSLCSTLSATGQWEHDQSQMPTCEEDPAEYIQVTDARDHIYEEPSLIGADEESDAGDHADPLYIDPNDESIETVKKKLPEIGSQPHASSDQEVTNSANSINRDISIVSLHSPQTKIENKVESRNHLPEDINKDSKAESELLRSRAKQMAERHSVDLDQSIHEVTMQHEFEQRLVVAEEAQRQLKEQQRRRSGGFVSDSEEKRFKERIQLEEKAKVLNEVKVEKERERQQREEFKQRLEEAARKRVEKEEKIDKERSLEKGLRSSPNIVKLIARRKEEAKQIEQKLSHRNPNGIDPSTLQTDRDAWGQLRKEEKARIKRAALRRISRSVSPGAVSKESTISREERAMEAAFLALNDSFAEMGLRSSMIPEQTAEEETEGPIETVESELDLDLLLADLDKAITLATERVISGTVEQEIAYASGTRNRKKMLTPQNTPQKSLTPQMTPRDTPGSSKCGTPSAADMRDQLRRLVLDGQRQDQSLKNKSNRSSSKKKKKAEKTDSKPKEEARFIVYDDAGSEFSVSAKKTMTTQMLVHQVTEQAGRQLLPTLSIVESFQDLHIERRLEDHELVDDVVQSWQGHKATKLIIRDTPTKYDLWEKPQVG